MSDNPKSAIANAGNLIIPESDWYSFYYEQTSGIELQSQAGVLGIIEPAWYDFYYEQQQVVYATGSSLYSVDGQQLTSEIGETAQTGTAYSRLTGILETASLGTVVISGTENVSVIVSGVETSATVGEISAQGQIIVNSEIQISGISATFSLSEISVSIENPEVWSSGKIKRYPANAFKNSSVKLSGIVTQTAQSDVIAFGTVQINATIALNNVVSFTQVANINADGILSISDDELILLMAA